MTPTPSKSDVEKVLFDWQKPGLSKNEIAELLGKHIFRWGAQSFPLKTELFKDEMKKACGQLASALAQTREEAYEDAAKVADNYRAYGGCPGKELSEKIRQLKGARA